MNTIEINFLIKCIKREFFTKIIIVTYLTLYFVELSYLFLHWTNINYMKTLR